MWSLDSVLISGEIKLKLNTKPIQSTGDPDEENKLLGVLQFPQNLCDKSQYEDGGIYQWGNTMEMVHCAPEPLFTHYVWNKIWGINDS